MVLEKKTCFLVSFWEILMLICNGFLLIFDLQDLFWCCLLWWISYKPIFTSYFALETADYLKIFAEFFKLNSILFVFPVEKTNFLGIF